MNKRNSKSSRNKENIETCFWSYHQLQLLQHRSTPISPPPKTSKLAVTAASRHHLGNLLLYREMAKNLDHKSINLSRTKKSKESKQSIICLVFFLTCESGDHNLLRTANLIAPHADFAALAPRAAASSWRRLNSVPPANTLFSLLFSIRSRWWLVFQRIFEGAAADASYDDAGFYNLRVFRSAIASCKNT